MEEKLLKKILDKLNEGEISALVTLTYSEGSTPRKSGSMMVVSENGDIEGSVGGGMVEAYTHKCALECIENSEGMEFSYSLNEKPEEGMICGGQVRGYIKVFLPKPKLVIIGGGHVAQSICGIAKNLEFNIVVLEDRVEFMSNKAFEKVQVILGDLQEKLKNLKTNKDTYFIVATRGHALDKEAIEIILNKEYKYVGMLGSKKKVFKLMEMLKEQGFKREKLNTIYTPVGLDISDGTPGEIAISILAEILKIKNNGSLVHKNQDFSY
ncbi:XdhC family protein [Clostridium frigidicarnis]|uniref:Xanthine dehydrogenase accessory factor n=1 Tax=Clostridium frigidicarnis TaxID=84698 RepID=A0A1I0YI43_9CLOT|nr:XdhC/CoxI family protein [Clostridium frigidicarnis]SFB12160.1 xanthine dehydrogenase accessory factor [Clostridium frigidicarnis]